MSDYVILIDENGQPYIAHSVFTKARDAVKSAGRSAHKYVAKIGEGAKARYFYTQEELKAFYNRGKAAVRKAIGYDARDRYKAAKMRLDNAWDEYRDPKSGRYKVYSDSDGTASRRAHDESRRHATDEFKKASGAYDRTILGTLERSKKLLATTMKSVKSDVARKKAKGLTETVERVTSKYRRPDENYYTLDRATGLSVRMRDLYDGTMTKLNTALENANRKAANGENISRAEAAEIDKLLDELKKYSVHK